MKFFHVYNEQYFEGLEKNGLINEDTGFKIQHVFSLPQEQKFNQLAAKGTKLHSLIKSGNYPFYVDRIAGGVTYHKYDFDRALIREYADLLGDWFLGFQLHESASNLRTNWNRILEWTGGCKGPYDVNLIKEKAIRSHAVTPDGEVLYALSQGSPEEFACQRFAETPDAYFREVETMFRKRMAEVDGFILPCDSGYQFAHMQNGLGMRSFMPEVGCQIPMMRMEVALARGIAGYDKKLWGTYYETWMHTKETGYSMPCYNTDPGNEWHLSQQQHPDDFTSFGENGGSSRLLQKRIYYYTLMSGADYMAEEWGLNCSYTDMQTFELSSYGLAKKEFIEDARTLRDIKAQIPFAIVLPMEYNCVQIRREYDLKYLGIHQDSYMGLPVEGAEKANNGHVENILKLIYGRHTENIYGNEGHTMTNSCFGDLFDIIYEDAPAEVLKKYTLLIDASADSRFARAKRGQYPVAESRDLEVLAHEIHSAGKATLPCTADCLHWLLSQDSNGRRFVSVFNNEGNTRTTQYGDVLDRKADRTVTLTFQEPVQLTCLKESTPGSIRITKKDDCTYLADIPAAGFGIFTY